MKLSKQADLKPPLFQAVRSPWDLTAYFSIIFPPFTVRYLHASKTDT